MSTNIVVKLSVLILILSQVLIIGAKSQHSNVADSPTQICPIKIGATIPSMKVYRTDGKSTDLANLVKDKPTVLIFYRGGW
jgi:cytochrome oxidase Cu insertion factor (SCO1/SenC/PrrC family)